MWFLNFDTRIGFHNIEIQIHKQNKKFKGCTSRHTRSYPKVCGSTKRPGSPNASIGFSNSLRLQYGPSLSRASMLACNSSLSCKSSPWMRSMGSNRSPRSTCNAGRHSRMTRNASEWPVPPGPELIFANEFLATQHAQECKTAKKLQNVKEQRRWCEMRDTWIRVSIVVSQLAIQGKVQLEKLGSMLTKRPFKSWLP